MDGEGGARQFGADRGAPLLGQQLALGQAQRLHIMLIFVGRLEGRRDEREKERRCADGGEEQPFQAAPRRREQHVGARRA